MNPVTISGTPTDTGDGGIDVTARAAHVTGLATSAVRHSTGTYNTTDILGFRILVIGTGTLTLSPKSGATDIVITAAELTAMGINAFNDGPMHLDSITLGNADMEVLLYIPS